MTRDVSATEFCKRATETAEHFGFQTVEGIRAVVPPVDKVKLVHTMTAQDRKLDAAHGLLTAGAQYFIDHRLHHIDGPVLFYTLEQVPRTGDVALALHIFGVEKSIAEAILIQTTRSLATDLGFTNTSVRINSLGDRESITRFNRELNTYLKKRLEDMPPTARELMKEHPFVALMHLLEKEHELGYKCPNPMEYLSDQSRKHFREVVEYLDMSETPYEIDPKFLGHHECYSDTIFTLDTLDEDDLRVSDAPLSVRGGRYTAFTEKFLKRPLGATSAVVTLKEKKAPQRTPRASLPKHAPIYVVQLGFGPKIRSLLLVDELRRAGIAVKQNLASDSLSAQLRAAEAGNAAYTIIIGQKEYVDGTAILRDMTGRNQESVPLPEVIARLKKSCAVKVAR
jgi:histidyl-tRNA synthetase